MNNLEKTKVEQKGEKNSQQSMTLKDAADTIRGYLFFGIIVFFWAGPMTILPILVWSKLKHCPEKVTTLEVNWSLFLVNWWGFLFLKKPLKVISKNNKSV